MKTISITIFIVCLAGCAPAPYDYYRPSAPGGELVNKGYIAGPANAIILKNQEFDIEVRYIDYIQFQLFVPEGKTLNVKEPYLWVDLDGKGFSKKYDVVFKRFSDGTITNTLVGFKRSNFIQRNGSNYIARVKIGKIPDKFEIKLPIFTTENNNIIRFSDVEFKNSAGWVITPIN
jgi:hypothetical protein